MHLGSQAMVTDLLRVLGLLSSLLRVRRSLLDIPSNLARIGEPIPQTIKPNPRKSPMLGAKGKKRLTACRPLHLWRKDRQLKILHRHKCSTIGG